MQNDAFVTAAPIIAEQRPVAESRSALSAGHTGLYKSAQNHTGQMRRLTERE